MVDGHGIFRRGLVASLEQLDDVAAVASAGSVAEAWADPRLADADLVLVDPPASDGAQFVAEVRRTTAAAVVVCTTPSGDDDARALLAAGAIGFVGKEGLTLEVLAAALRAAIAGSGYLAPEVMRSVVGDGAAGDSGGAPGGPEPAHAAARRARLTEREQQVLALIAEGHATREVAATMCYSERTVKNVLHDAVTKLNARSRSHAVAHAVRAGLV